MDARLLSFKNSKKSSPIWMRELIAWLTMIKYFYDRSYSNRKTPKWFVWYSLQLINTSVFICHEEILGIAIPFLFQDIPRGRWLSGCHDTKLHSEVGQAPVNKAGTPTPSLNTEKRNLMSWMSKTKLQTNDITRANTCFWWVSEQVSSWNNTPNTDGMNIKNIKIYCAVLRSKRSQRRSQTRENNSLFIVL